MTRLSGFIRANLPEMIVLAVLFADLFIKVLPAAPLFVLIVLLQFLRLDINSNIFLCLQGLSVFAGAAFNTMGISGLGGAFLILGAGLLVYGIIKGYTELTYTGLLSFIPLIVILLYFTVSMMLTSGGDFAGKKLSLTFKNGIASIIAFVVIFTNLKRTNTDLLGVYLILYALFLLRLSIDTNTIPGPSGLFDFAFMRTQTIEVLGYVPEVFCIGYQHPGFYALQGVGLYMLKYHSDRSIPVILLILAGIISLYAGARQMIIGVFVIALIWVLASFGRRGIFIVALMSLLVPLLYFFSSNINELFSSTVEEGYVEGGGRGIWLLAGVQMFLDNPILGAGFGRFNLMGDYDTYPHNLIIEILCETGIVGFVVIIGILILMLVLTRHYIRRYIYYLLALVVMAMASGCMYDNIIIFTLVFAATSFIPSRQIKFITTDESRELQTC